MRQIDMRKTNRFLHKAPVLYAFQNSDRVYGATIRNYCKKGMCFEAGYSLEPGDEIVIMLENFPRDANVHAMSHRYHATVRWCKPLADSQAFFYNVGVEYERLDL